jgi:hypothetical protein
MKNFVFILTAFFFINISAQKIGPITITHGEEIKDDSQKIVKIAGEANNKIYTLAYKGKKTYIKVFSKDMKLLSVNIIEKEKLQSKGKKIIFEDFVVLDQKLYVFGSVFDRKAKKLNLYAFQVSEDGKLSSEKKEILSASVTKGSERGAYYFKESPHGDKLLILHASLFKKEDLIKYELKLIGSNLETDMSTIEKIPFKDRRDLEFTISDFDLDSNDNVYLVINESYRDRKAKKNIEKFYLHSYKKANNYGKDILNINADGKEIMNCELLSTNKGVLHLAGLYSSVKKSGRANWRLKGAYAVSINTDSNTLNKITFTPFDYDTKVKLIGERRANKGKDVLPYYVTHSLIEKEDGGLILMSEFLAVYQGRSSGIGPISFTPITFINNEIIVTSFNPDGTVKWTNVVPKKQTASYTVLSLFLSGFGGNSNFTVGVGLNINLATLGKGPEYLSVIPIYKNGELTVIYNDNPKNNGLTDMDHLKKMVNYNKSVPVIMTFNDNGKIKRVDQNNYTKEQLIIRPRVFFRRSDNEYLIYSSKRKSDKLGVLIIN